MMESEKQLIPGMIRKYGWLLAIVAIAFVAGYFAANFQKDFAGGTIAQLPPSQSDHDHNSISEVVSKTWTCSMHPQIRLPNPGKCPICFMDLIPLESDKDSGLEKNSLQITMSENAARLAQIQTSPVIKAFAKYQISMIGMVFEDETRVAALTSRIEGRLDDVYVNFTGVRVNKGDPMVKIWSPTLIRGQVELFETLRGVSRNEEVVKGAEEKLIQYGLTQEQIEEIKANNKPLLNLTLLAPISGIVTKKNALLGQFVREGMEMFIINDLSHVWVKLDAYESDMPWIRYGQDVTFTASAVPGKVFRGKVLFIDPVLDTKTRSVKIRVEAENPDLLLKPGMFVSALLEAELDKDLKVVKTDWTGKYVCPIHPRDQASPIPGTCPDSKMPLRQVSEFGYSDNPNPEPPLLIPISAPLITGKRAIVFVQKSGAHTPTYELREITLGPKTSSHYVVLSGLSEGEKVVTKGAFKLDSAMQISARPSMMNESDRATPNKSDSHAEEELIERIEVTDSFREELNSVINHYLKLKEAVVEDDVNLASEELKSLVDSARKISPRKESTKAQEFWLTNFKRVSETSGRLLGTNDIEAMRRGFETISESVSRLVMGFGHNLDSNLKLYYCPMAFDNAGAYWLEKDEQKTNPYFGRKPHKGQDMLKCGELQETIESTSVEPKPQ